MKTYSILYAEDVPHYATAEIEADNDAEAIAKAKRLSNMGDLEFSDPDWENPIIRRVVNIEDCNCITVANDISLDGHQLLVDSKVRDAIQYALECLGNFKADWLTKHGLKVAIERLESAYTEVGGAS
jgi:hypothetical protein